jgi:hypothetical protein
MLISLLGSLYSVDVNNYMDVLEVNITTISRVKNEGYNIRL